MNYQLGLIGYPIEHSLSPWIHKQFLDRCEIKGSYELMEIDPEKNFTHKITELKTRDLHGFNITVPYKEKILDFLDEIDDSAKKIGAVNTVHCKNGKWIGYNTDGIGYVRSLQYAYPKLLENKSVKILILGAGGAAKGIYHGLLRDDYTNITISNRTIENAEEITKGKHPVMDLKEAEARLWEFDLVIQTSSVGMKPNVGQSIISLSNLKNNAIVSDIVYQPLMTKFLKDAKNLGAQVHFGHTMLLFQAQAAFRIWTEQHPNMDGLATQLQSVLEG